VWIAKLKREEDKPYVIILYKKDIVVIIQIVVFANTRLSNIIA
jgi:hypothetical protein